MSDTLQLLTNLQASGFRDLAGSRVSARVPVSGALLNRLVAEALAGRGTPVRAVDIQPRPGDRFDVAITVSWPFVPTLHATFAVERQPSFPASPILVLRWSFLGLVGSLASRLIAHFEKLPSGIRLDGDQLLLDIPALAANSAVGPMLVHIKALELHTLDGRTVVELELGIPE